MSKTANDFLQVSAKLYKHLTELPSGDERTEYINIINQLLDQRGVMVGKLKDENFQYNSEDATHKMLFELDKGIRERLDLVLSEVKNDIKDLYNAKKNELHYIDPYEKLRNLDGRYFDGKK